MGTNSLVFSRRNAVHDSVDMFGCYDFLGEHIFSGRQSASTPPFHLRLHHMQTLIVAPLTTCWKSLGSPSRPCLWPRVFSYYSFLIFSSSSSDVLQSMQ